MNILSNMDQIADIIIRPTRYLYKPIDLGPKIINVNSKTIYHHDFQVKNSRGLLLKASLYTDQDNIKNIKTLLMYLHCNSGCRIQGTHKTNKGLAYMKLALANQFSYVVFDFSGSGLSEGKYVSLGFYEAEDIKSVIKHLKKRINESIKFILWGRSMGAVATLRYLSLQQNQKNVLAGVFDSPFQSLKQLFLQVGKQKTNLPKIVLQVALKYLKPLVQSKANFDIDEVNLNKLSQIQDCPAVFIASKKDSLIPFIQMDNIFKEYKSAKEMLFVEQNHNQPRNMNVIKEVFSTIKKLISNSALQIQNMFKSEIPAKDHSRKKLQLTIKSYSQKDLLLVNKSSQTPRTLKGNLNQITYPHLQKREISCLFENRKKSKNTTLSQQLMVEDSEYQSTSSLIKNKKKQITLRKFFKDENENSLGRVNLVKFKSQKEREGTTSTGNLKFRDQQRKTMQHMANKKPPYIDNNKIHEFRSSFESKYRSEFKI